MINRHLIIIAAITLFIFLCCKKSDNLHENEVQENQNQQIEPETKTYTIPIIYGGKVPRESFDELIEGFKEKMDRLLEEEKSQAEYHIIYHSMTQERKSINAHRTRQIINQITQLKPDLICTINTSLTYVDQMIAKKLSDPRFKFVSLNPIPVKSGIINSWEKPGGNITGVGVFIQLNSPLRLMKMIDPGASKVISYSWDIAGHLNDWLEEKLIEACRKEGFQLIQFKRIKSFEEELALYQKYNQKNKGYFFLPILSARIDRNGNPVDMAKLLPEFIKKNINHIPIMSYDETIVKNATIAGTSVVWNDIGAQLAEKGYKIIYGKNPGDMPWEYPRKYNIILNKKRAEKLNIKLPQTIINAAYKIYTDFEGNYVGQK